MKKSKSFTPPLKKFSNIIFRSSRQFIIFTSCLTIGLVSFGPSNVSAQIQEESSSEKTDQISSFADYLWGTSYADIYSDKITQNMKAQIDYLEDESDNSLSTLTVFHQEIAGYSDVSSSYIFSDQKLTAGEYDLKIDDKTFEDLSEKMTVKYGDPYLTKDSTGWGKLSIWIDESKNIISLSEILNILYVEADSPLLDTLNEQFIEFHELDLLSEINKYKNSNGL